MPTSRASPRVGWSIPPYTMYRPDAVRLIAWGTFSPCGAIRSALVSRLTSNFHRCSPIEVMNCVSPSQTRWVLPLIVVSGTSNRSVETRSASCRVVRS